MVDACVAALDRLSCIVHFNEAERTWDRPCHGSRFDLKGHVLDGPATDDLSPEPTPDDRAS